jgi:hypothetical protein
MSWLRKRLVRAWEERMPLDSAEEVGFFVAVAFPVWLLIYAGVMWWAALPILVVFEAVHFWNLK